MFRFCGDPMKGDEGSWGIYGVPLLMEAEFLFCEFWNLTMRRGGCLHNRLHGTLQMLQEPCRVYSLIDAA